MASTPRFRREVAHMIGFPLSEVGGELFFEGVSTLRLAEEFGTPLYVISEGRIRQNYGRLRAALKSRWQRFRILYSAKANTNPSVLRILEEEGACLDAVSPGEVYLARRGGFPPGRILFTGTSVGDEELGYLLGEGVVINVDSLSQLRRLLRIAVPEALSVRVNPELGAGHHEHVITAGRDSKFGVWEEDSIRAYDEAKGAGVRRFGIQMHIGSGILSPEPLLRAADRLLSIAGEVHETLGVCFDFVDFGGGLGVPYRPDEAPLGLDEFADGLVGLFRRRVEEYSLGTPEIWLEPGRYLVADAGILLTRVNTLKSTPFRRFAGVDAGFNTLVRPAMYGSYHHILVANNMDGSPEEEYDVVGPICESGDFLARDRRLPRLSEGDLLAVLDAGAYGFSMSSQYNSRPRAAEVMVRDGRYCLVRARETFEGLLRGVITPHWLEG